MRRPLAFQQHRRILIFAGLAGEQSIVARHEGDKVWLIQKQRAELFEVEACTVSEHLKNIFLSRELGEVFRLPKTINNTRLARPA